MELKKLKKGFGIFGLAALIMLSFSVSALSSKNTEATDNEIVYERDEYTKKYQNDDGSITADIYATPIHYKDENGDWKNINNLLGESEDKTSYENTDTPLKIKFANKASHKKLVTITNDGYKISWGIENANKVKGVVNNHPNDSKIETLTSEIKYDNVFKDTTLKYTLSSYSLIEELIMNSVPTYDSVVYYVNCKGLKAKVANQEVIFYTDDTEEKEIYKFAVPYMYDSAEKPKFNMNVGVSIEETKDGYKVTHTFDMDWLKSEDRVYPVVLDPIVTSYQHYSNIEDTYTNSNNPNTNYVNTPYLKIGKDNGNNYIFVKITSLPDIGVNSTINSATLGLYLNYGTTTWGALSIYELNRVWDSYQLTWNNQTDLVNQASILQNGIYPTATGGYYKYNIDVTSTYIKWYDGTLNNYGFYLRYQNLNYNDWNNIYSSDNLGIGSTYLPAITVNYTPNIPDIKEYRDLNWHYPLPSQFTTLAQGWHAKHHAIDIEVPIGYPVYAAQNGTVASVLTTANGYSIGNAVAITTTDLDPETNTPLIVDYGHLDRILVQKGQTVTRGQIIGYSGNTGNGQGPHLQVEVTRKGKVWATHTAEGQHYSVDPALFWFN